MAFICSLRDFILVSLPLFLFFFFELSSLILFLPAFVEAGAAKNLVLNCLPAFFCGAEPSINAYGVEHKSSWNSFSIFFIK